MPTKVGRQGFDGNEPRIYCGAKHFKLFHSRRREGVLIYSLFFRLGPLGLSFGLWDLLPNQVQFPSIEQFPLDLLASAESDSRSQRDREVDIEPLGSSLGADRLYMEFIFCLPGHSPFLVVNNL